MFRRIALSLAAVALLAGSAQANDTTESRGAAVVKGGPSGTESWPTSGGWPEVKQDVCRTKGGPSATESWPSCDWAPVKHDVRYVKGGPSGTESWPNS